MPRYRIEGKIYDAGSEDEAYEMHEKAAPSKGRALADQLRTLPQDMLRQGGLAVRNVVTGLTGIPGMAADAAMAGYNLATGSDQQMRAGFRNAQRLNPKR